MKSTQELQKLSSSEFLIYLADHPQIYKQSPIHGPYIRDRLKIVAGNYEKNRDMADCEGVGVR